MRINIAQWKRRCGVGFSLRRASACLPSHASFTHSVSVELAEPRTDQRVNPEVCGGGADCKVNLSAAHCQGGQAMQDNGYDALNHFRGVTKIVGEAAWLMDDFMQSHFPGNPMLITFGSE